MKRIGRACFLIGLVAGLVGVTERALAINFSGQLVNAAGAALVGATVRETENIGITTTTSGTGNFTLTGLPSGTDFSLEFIAATYANGYSRNFNRTIGASGLLFALFTPAEITNWYTNTLPPVIQNPSGGNILGRVFDNDTGTSIGGAKVTYTSSLGNTYPVYYFNGTTSKYVAGQATFANGRYYIFNVADGDTVTVTASKTNWTFSPITFDTHSGTLNVSVGNLFGTNQTVYLPLILSN